MLRKIFSFFFNRFTLVLCGLVLLSLLVWFVGPLVYIKPYQPLESEAVRGWIIAALFGIWFLRLFIRWWRAKEMNARLLGQLARIGASDASAPEAGPGKEEVAELEKRFKEAVDVLGKTRFGQTEQGWFGRLSRRYLYQLPWYLIIGSPGSGKTTALVNSGLDFPLAAQFGKASIRGVGGTRNCDWWFTDQAVLLDTAGRYTTQESDEAQDSAAWSGFLGLLRRFRGRQPINGVLVTLSVQELLSGGDAERERLARLIGLRLAELCEGLSIKFPVYVLVTKTDLLAGFNEFFGNMTREERAQVWGFTNPYVEGQAQEDPGLQFRKEFDGLADQINRLLPQRLLAEPDLARRGQIYGLPQQFVGLRDVVQQTLSTIFASSRFKEKPLFRGVYFTSGTQEGMPFDRVLSALSRRFSVAPPAHPAGEGRAGKSYFIETLLKGGHLQRGRADGTQCQEGAPVAAAAGRRLFRPGRGAGGRHDRLDDQPRQQPEIPGRGGREGAHAQAGGGGIPRRGSREHGGAAAAAEPRRGPRREPALHRRFAAAQLALRIAAGAQGADRCRRDLHAAAGGCVAAPPRAAPAQFAAAGLDGQPRGQLRGAQGLSDALRSGALQPPRGEGLDAQRVGSHAAPRPWCSRACWTSWRTTSTGSWKTVPWFRRFR